MLANTPLAQPSRIPPPRIAADAKPSLLFVDDEERILRSLRMMFAQQYKVHTTTSGAEALDIMRNQRIHAVVSDQRMPIMPGVELLRQAREVSPNTMRLLLTGYSDLEAVTGSINDGEIFRYISKPWNPDEIRTTIGSAVDIAMRLESAAKPMGTFRDHPQMTRILVIDDDPDVPTQIKALLDEQLPDRHVVEWASDVDSVFRILEQMEVALVVTEVRLGGEDISELIKSLKRHQPNIITVALSTFRDSTALVDLINQAQLYRYMLKPMRRALLWRSIESGLERHHALKSVPVLASQHKVENSSSAPNSPTASRILGFFRNLGKKPH